MDLKFNLSNGRISYFNHPITNTNPESIKTLNDIYQIIKGPLLEAQTKKCRSVISKQDLRRVKNQLPFITPSGVFSRRHSEALITFSGYVAIDIDDLELSSISEVRKKLIGYKKIPTALLFISPSGKGLKWIVPMPKGFGSTKACYESISALIAKDLNIKVDPQGGDVARACFLCRDADAYFNGNIKPDTYSLPETNHSSKPDIVIGKTNDGSIDNKSETESLLNQILMSGTCITNDYQDWLSLGLVLVVLLGENGRGYYHALSSCSQKYDSQESDRKYSELLKNTKSKHGFGTLYNLAKKFNITQNTENLKNSNDNQKLKPLPKSEGLTVLKVQSANDSINEAKLQANPKMIFSEFWHEGEFAILFADTNVGKSILSVQIADSISTGKPIEGFKLELKAQNVCLFDFEMSNKQFEKRYSFDYQEHYTWDPKFQRSYVNPKNVDFDRFEERIIEEMEMVILKVKCKILIVDNITYLNSGSNEKGQEAQTLMKKLKQLKEKHNLSILALAHTPKRDRSKALSINDLAGSRQIANFADSIFALGVSQKGSSIRYVIQLKERATAKLYGPDNVVSCEVKKEHNFLKLVFDDYGEEKDHLPQMQHFERDKKNDLINAEKRQNPNATTRDIAEQYGVSHATVANIWKKEGL
jgi:hypothetical protein